ncbi:hypothetical protein J4458_07205 [Candidatus Woesearchaeota archaeon]|nr:hypothetical protein [Candidatus Woesearchaeota archaeon]
MISMANCGAPAVVVKYAGSREMPFGEIDQMVQWLYGRSENRRLGLGNPTLTQDGGIFYPLGDEICRKFSQWQKRGMPVFEEEVGLVAVLERLRGNVEMASKVIGLWGSAYDLPIYGPEEEAQRAKTIAGLEEFFQVKLLPGSEWGELHVSEGSFMVPVPRQNTRWQR